MKATAEQTDCSDAIQDQLYTTTVLRSPNKMNSCRIGLVFYQHGNLHLPQHGKAKTERKNLERELAATPPQEQKQMLGKCLFPLIQRPKL